MAFRNKTGAIDALERNGDQRQYVCAYPPFDINEALEKAGINKSDRLAWFGGTNNYRVEGKDMVIAVPLNLRKEKIIERFSLQLTEAFKDWRIIVDKGLGL